MASRSLGEFGLRPFSSSRIYQLCTPSKRRIPLMWSGQRAISSTRPQAAHPQLKEAEEEEEEYSPRAQPPPPRNQDEISREIDARFLGPRLSNTPPIRTTSNDELKASRLAHVFGAEFSPVSSSRVARQRPKLQFDDLIMPEEITDPSPSNKPTELANLQELQEKIFANHPRLNPAYGRTVELDLERGRDIVRSVSMLASLVTRNKVRYDFAKQKFHERGGLKRKRLASERWRARFKTGFQHVTSRVTELTRKGW